MTFSVIQPVDMTICEDVFLFDQHVAYASSHGMCSAPGAGCTSYYYGGDDKAPRYGYVNRDIRVNAAADGKIIKVGYDGKNTASTGYGWRVMIDHGGGWQTVYGHLQEGSTVVKVGDKVKAGDMLGLMGGTGNCRPPGYKHLHFEIRYNGVPQNPALHYVDQQPPIITPPPTYPPPDVTPPPEYQPPNADYPLVSNTWRVLQDVNIRLGPGINYPTIGAMLLADEGKTVEVDYAVTAYPGSVWLHHARGWSAYYHNYYVYLDPVKE